MMTKFKLSIELLSDLCVSDGSSYNSSVDLDVCHDEYGFPFIPAKRLKGCFRENALELNDWGRNISIEKIFGDKGDKRANIVINNAYLEDYYKNKKLILKNRYNPIFHYQNVLNNYTYIRSQTSVDYDKGVAKKGSLRTIRVVNKGLVFVSVIEIDDIYKKDLEEIISITTNIGSNRTRGFGEVKMSLSEISKEDCTNNNEILEDVDCLMYHIELKEPVILKGYNSDDLNTIDYFEGNKVLGVIASGFKDGNFVDFVNQSELFVSNAYLEKKIFDEVVRLKETPASYYAFKNIKSFCFDKALDSLRNIDILKQRNEKQAVKLGHSYMHLNSDGKINKYSVDISDRYHHSRPVDKSFGHALDDEDSKFFQLSSIDANQSFGGFITGSKEQINKIYNILNNKECRMGFGRSSEYGQVLITVDKPYKAPEEKEKVKSKKFVVKLVSPAIIYDDNASYSTKNEDLVKEVNRCLNIDLKVENSFVNIVKIGGYNVTWKSRKPIIYAFDKGTVLIYDNPNEEMVVLNSKKYIGERIQEGFGEIEIYELELKDSDEIYFDIDYIDRYSEEIGTDDKFVKSLCDRLFRQYMKTDVSKRFNKNHSKAEYRPVVSNLLLMLKQKDYTFDKFKQDYSSRFDKKIAKKQKKLEMTKSIVECYDEKNNLIQSFCKDNKLKNDYSPSFDLKLEYIRAYLHEMKYRIREKSLIKEESTNGK